MTERHLESMHIDPTIARNAVDILEAYATACLDELRPPLGGPTPDKARPDDDEQWDEASWGVAADAASAFREAGQWALLTDSPRGVHLLGRAADLFVQLQHAFGFFLKVAVGYWWVDPPHVLGQHVPYLLGDSAKTPPVLRHPQQQAYLLLAAVGSEPVAYRYNRLLYDVATTSPHRRGVTPVGALGTPIHRYWAIAEAMCDGDGAQPRAVAANHLEAMARQHQEVIELAAKNDFLWSHASAPVDVVDIDLICLLVLGMRSFGPAWAEEELLNRPGMRQNHPMMVQMDIATELVRL